MRIGKRVLTKLLGRAKVSIGVTEAARRLNVSPKTIYYRIYTGKLKASRPDGHWRIDEHEL